jgi:transposase
MNYVGVDVSLHELVVWNRGLTATHANTPKGIRVLLRSLPADTRIAMEATNVYHCALAEAATKAGFTAYVLDPRRTKAYVDALGIRGKCDPTDARAIAQFAETMADKMRPFRLPDASALALRTLIRQRSALVDTRCKVSMALKGTEMAKEFKQYLVAIDQLIKAFDRKIEERVREDAGYALLRTIPGFGVLTATAVLCTLRLGDFKTGDSIVGYAGLDPIPNQSGGKVGRRRLSKQGDPLLRRFLYLAAMSGRNGEAWAPLWERLLAKGLKPIQAILALARKLLQTAWSIYKYQTKFDRNRIQGAAFVQKA